MLTILHTLESPVIESLGWALVHFLWQATLLAVLLAVVLLVLRRASSRVKYVVQCSVLLAMAACPAVTWWWIASTMKPNAATAVLHVEPVVPNELKSGHVEPVVEPMVTGAMGLDGPIDANSIMLAPAPAMSAVAPQPDQMEVPRPDQAVSWNKRVRSGMAPILPWFVGAWLLGVLVLSLRLLVGWRIVQRLKRLAVTPADAAWQLRLKALAARLRVTRTVRLVESSLIEVPTVIGWIRPMILLPVSLLTSLTPQQLEAVLAHELAHIRRHDYLVNLIQTAIETLLFYHPAVWWLSRMIRAEREHCCDDLALSLCDNPVTYVSALAAMEELRASPTLTIAATGGSLLNRIRRIALGPAHDSRRSIWWGASLIALMVIASLGVTTYIASHADDHEQKTVAITEAAETEPQAESDRPEAAAMEEFRGRVLNHLKKPVAGATVVVSVVSGDGYENRESTVATVLTDEAGDFRLSVLSSELKRNDTTSKANLWAWTSDVARDGFGVVPIQPDQEQPIKMSLFRPMTEVVELAGTNGEPVRGTVERLNFSMGVNLILPDDLFKQVLPQPMVSGSFRILGFPIDMDEEAGEEVNDVDDEEAKSPTRAEWRSMRIQTADRGRQVLMWHPTIRKDVPTRLLMREPTLLQGRLTTSSGTLPADLLKQTEIVLESHDSVPGKLNLFRTGIARVRCDSEGRFEVRDLPAGKLAISLHTGNVTGWSWRTPRGTDGEPLELPSGVVTNVEIPLIRTRTVRGQIVTQSGEPLPNVELSVTHGTTRRKVRVDKGVETTSEHGAVVRTNERGEFSVDVIPGSIFISKSGSPGLGMLTAIRWPTDPAIALPDRGLRVDSDETPLHLPPLKLTVLTGRVIDHERRPYKGLIIAKGAEPDESFGLNYSRKDGTFRLEGIGEPSEFKVYSIENSNQIPFETPDTETTVISHNPLILQVTPKAKKADEAGEASLPNGLEFLKPYPKLHGLSLDMTEPQFLEIVKQQVLKTRKTVDGEKVTHHIALGDGHSLVVMFDKDGKCGGIQRVRGAGENVDEKLQPQVSIQDVVRGVDFSKVKVHGHDEESLRQIPDLNVPDPENPGSLKSPKNVFPMPLGEHTWLMYPAGSGRFYIEHRPDGTPQSELIYGPIDGDPFEVLKLDDLFRERLKPGANEGDPRYRLTLMLHTGDPQLIRRAWRLVEPELDPKSSDVEKSSPDAEPAARYSDRDEWRGNRLESLERVREALRDEAETFRKPELSEVATRMRETVAAVEAVIDAINDSVPDESYQSATYLQPKIQAKLPDALWGKPVSGLRLGLVPTHSRPTGADWNTLPADAWLPTSIIARPGEPLHYLLMVENVSEHEIKFSGYVTGEDIGRSMEILDRHGKPVRYDSLHTTIPHTINHWRLKPGERKLFTMPAVYFHPATPNMPHKGLGYHATVPDGRYSVRCSYYFGGLDKERHRHVAGRSQWIGKLTTGTQTITFGDGGADATANAPATTPAVGLDFLKPYPKLHGMSLAMTEPQFLEIVKQQELKTRKTVEGDKVTHHIALGDGQTLIVMFDKDSKCRGIQRVRGEALPSRLFVNVGVNVGGRTTKDRTRFSQSVVAINPNTGKWTRLQSLNEAGFTVPLSPVRVSPDGQTMLFIRKNEVWKCDAATGEQAERVLEKGSPVAWSPDSKTFVAVVAKTENDPQDVENWIVSLDGQKQSVLELTKGDAVEDWSADGQWLAVRARYERRIFVVKPDGSGRRYLADSTPFQLGRTGFSPDSQRIVYIRQQEPDDKRRFSLRTINVDGTGDREILGETNANSIPFFATWTAPMAARWSPDGKHLAVVLFDHAADGAIAAINGNWRLAIIDADGGNFRELKLEGTPTTVLPWDGPEWRPTAPDKPLRDEPKSSQSDTVPAKGLEFLRPYPKLHGLSLDTTEPEFLEIVKQQELKTKKMGEGDKTAYYIGLGDGLTLIVMFRNDGTCRGIQRIRGEDSGEPAELRVADVVRDFNAKNTQLGRGLDQPTMTEDELIAVIKRDKWQRGDLWSLNEQEIAAFKGVAESKRLPKGSYLDVHTEDLAETFLWKQLWKVRLMLPAIGHDGFVGLTIRDTLVVEEQIDPKQVAWGKPDAEGLSLGAYLSPKKDKYQIGERVRLRLFVRNEGQNIVGNLTFYNLPTPDAKDFTVTDQTGANVVVRLGHEGWDLHLVAGATGGVLKPGDAHAFRELYEISIGGDGSNPLVGRVINARPGQTLQLKVRAFNGNDRERKVGDPFPESGIVTFAVSPASDPKAQAAANTSPADGLEFLKPYPKLHGLSLDMTEPQFVEIIKQQELKTRKTVDGEKVTHHIALGDGHTLIVMFGKDAKCSGIQRVRGEDKDSSNLSDKYSTPKQSPNPLVSALQPVEVNGPLDADGEVLPVGMVQRLGSTRFKVPGWWRRLAFAGNDEWVWLKADNRVSVIHRESGRVVKHHQLRLGEQNVWSLTASADGSRVAVGTTDFPPAADGTCHFRVVVLSAHTTAHLQELKWKARSGELNGLSFSADGSKLLTVSHRGNARLWELETGKMLLQQQFDGIDHVRHAALSPDAHTAVVTGLRGASMWKIAEDAAPIPLAADRCDSVSFAPNGRLFAIIAHDGVRLCNAETGESIVRLKSPEIESYSNADFGFQFTPDGKILAVPVPSHDVVELWDVETRRRLATLSVNQPRGVAISRDGRWMAAAGQDSFTAIFDLKTRQQVNQLGDGHSQEVLNVRFTGVGSLVSSSVGDARLWDIKSGKRQQTLPHESKTTTIRGLAVSPDGTLIVTSAFDDTLGLWNRATAKRLFTLKGHGTSGGTRAVKFKADGSQFVSWGDDAVLRWWNAKDGSLVAAHVLDVPDYTYQAGGRNPFASAGLCAAFAPDTSSLFVAFGEMLSEFETQTGKRLRQVPISRQASPLAVSSDGRWLAAGERRRNEQGDVTSTVIVLRDRATLKAVSEWTVNNPRDVVMAAIEPDRATRVSFIAENDNGMSFSPDSKFLAWSRIDAHPGIDILEVASNRLHSSIPVDSACWCLEFSPDGTQIASGHSDSTARVWDLKKPVFAVAGVAGLDFIKP